MPAPVFTIRRKASAVFTLEEYERQGIMSPRRRAAIEAAVAQRHNILVVGGTGTGKTTLTNAIINYMVQVTPQHRIVIIEGTSDLQCAAKNAVVMRATDTVDMQRLLKATMRLRPDRIIVGEVRGGEALSLLKAWNTGHPGRGLHRPCQAARWDSSDPSSRVRLRSFGPCNSTRNLLRGRCRRSRPAMSWLGQMPPDLRRFRRC